MHKWELIELKMESVSVIRGKVIKGHYNQKYAFILRGPWIWTANSTTMQPFIIVRLSSKRALRLVLEERSCSHLNEKGSSSGEQKSVQLISQCSVHSFYVYLWSENFVLMMQEVISHYGDREATRASVCTQTFVFRITYTPGKPLSLHCSF